MATDATYVIVGASLAGAKAAQALREEGQVDRVLLVGSETERPYERPPLSKGYLLGSEDREKIYVHDEKWYAEHDVELLLGRSVTNLDPGSHRIRLDDGEQIDYTKLLLTTGAAPRRLDRPGGDHPAVLYLRQVEDSERLRAVLTEGGRVVVVGAGWIGLETAAAARHYGCEVTVLDPQPTPLHAALGPEMGRWFADVHRRNGVDMRLGTGVSEIRTADDRVTAVVTDDGTAIPADAVVVGVGIRPRTELAEQAGLPVDNGIKVDSSLRTEDPDVYAAGDVANAMNPRYDRHIRVEHWANALNGGPAAARAMLGQEVTYDRLPYFFTDQYDVGMEFTGWFPPGGYDLVITRGDPDQQAFYAFWLTAGTVVAAMHVNLWDDGLDPARELIASAAVVDSEQLADPGMPLRELASR